jgi:hypothetical protein
MDVDKGMASFASINRGNLPYFVHGQGKEIRMDVDKGMASFASINRGNLPSYSQWGC